MSRIYDDILKSLPYSEPFLFVDKVLEIDDTCIVGEYSFLEDRDFYRGHFNNYPITPGVLIVESFAQIGGVAHGIYLLDLFKKDFMPAFANASFEFFNTLKPGETIYVYSKKVVLRKNYLKIKGEVFNSKNELIMQATGSCKFIVL